MIFYADDDLDDLQIFQEVADELHVSVNTFTNGHDLIERLTNPPPSPSIVFLDINMPGYNGLQILERIRTNDRWKDVPIVMFTTSVGEDTIEKSLLLGATYYLPKSPEYDKLAASIRYVLNQEWKDFLPSTQNFVHQQTSIFSIPEKFVKHKK